MINKRTSDRVVPNQSIYAIKAFLLLAGIVSLLGGCDFSKDLERLDAKTTIQERQKPFTQIFPRELYAPGSLVKRITKTALNEKFSEKFPPSWQALEKSGYVVQKHWTPGSDYLAKKSKYIPTEKGRKYLDGDRNAFVIGQPVVDIVAIEKPSENIRVAVYKTHIEPNEIGAVWDSADSLSRFEKQGKTTFVRTDDGGWRIQ